MDTIQLSENNQFNSIDDTLQTRNAHQNAADNVHYVEYLEETKPGARLKNFKNIVVFLITLIILLMVGNIILTAALLSKC